MHPLRLPYEMFTPANPFLKSVSSMAEGVRKNRQPVSPDNALWQAQERIGKAIESSLDSLPRHAGPVRGDAVSRRLRLAAGAGAGRTKGVGRSLRATGLASTPSYRAFVAQRIEELTRNIARRRSARGGYPRSPLYPHAGGRRR